MGVSRRSVQYVGRVMRDGIPELIAAVEQGGFAVSIAAEISRLPKEAQRRVLDRVRQGVKPARAFESEIVRLVRRERDGRR